jgi:hypothetical protein
MRRVVAPLSLLVSVLALDPAAQSELPLERWTDERWPTGVPFGLSFGTAFLDFDRDGWPDLYSHQSGNLWRNEAGRTWTLVANLHDFMPPTRIRYGAACADYDGDGLPDVATEQYGGCFYLLRNLGPTLAGTPGFLEVASDPAIVSGQPCGMYAETACWADVDGDGDLDLFVPAYPDAVRPGSGGNRFWRNLGPDPASGTHRLALETEQAGLTNPPLVERPEGAQFCDVDRDGDVDLFSNHTLYRNRSRTLPDFLPLGAPVTGIGFANRLDEGLVFLDHDLDGDPDLLVVYVGTRSRLWENRGDGTFFHAEEALEDPQKGARTGVSAEDWDLDGDVDVSTAFTFRRNLLVETGAPFLAVAEDDLPSSTWQSPGWADWDRDGDPDCVLVGGNSRAFLYRNTTSDTGRPRSIRVRVVRDSEDVPGGLETEFGATVELRVHGDTSGHVRRRFVASSHGYLQQSEYALTLAVPSDPRPQAPANLRFDLLVDFPGPPGLGSERVDGHVNPALRGLPLARLAGREITVFRSGKVVIDGVTRAPRMALDARLRTTGALALPEPEAPLPELAAAPLESWYVGVELDTHGARSAVRLDELVVGAVLDVAAGRAPHAPEHNVALWDVTDPGRPRRAWQAACEPRPRNRRQFLALDVALAPARRYRLVCRVTAARTLAHAAGAGALRIAGALAFQDLAGGDGATVAAAPLRAGETPLWLRFRTEAAPR